MNTYKTTEIVDIFGGKVGLTKKQAKRRPGKLRKLRGVTEGNRGLFEVVNPIQFKAGEVVMLENPDKITLAKLELVKSVKKAKDGDA